MVKNKKEWDIFITLIVSCTNPTIALGNMNFISLVGMEVYSNPYIISRYGGLQ